MSTGFAVTPGTSIVGNIAGNAEIQFDTTGVRIGTTTTIVSTERFSVNAPTSAGGTSIGGMFQTSITGDAAQTGSQASISTRVIRTITTNQTDTGRLSEISLQQPSMVVPTGQVITNTNALGRSGVYVQMTPVITGGGTIAYTHWAGISIESSTFNTGTRKIGLRLSSLSGATNNALISDNASFTGNYFINSTTTSSSLLSGLLDLSPSTAGQIKFPATQNASSNANTLDDYEEGTWTPTLNSWTNVGSPSFTGSNYTKIGNLVYLTAIITPGTSLSATSTVSTVTGLPFSPASSSFGSMGLGDQTSKGSFACGAASSGTLYPQTTGVVTTQVIMTVMYTV